MIATLLTLSSMSSALGGVGALDDEAPEARAVRYLAREVPRWSEEQECYSCHHDGDGARALVEAGRAGWPVEAGALEATLAWLARPEDWGKNGGRAESSDARLARIQFAAALATATEAGRIEGRAPLLRAAGELADDQEADGSWPIAGDRAGLIGSPATYGGPLATVAARDVLRAADPERFRGPIRRAERWLLTRPIRNVQDASCALLALDGASDPPPDAGAIRGRARELLARGESEGGGWGPYETAAPEVFDTALALIALERSADDPASEPMIRRGRRWLIAAQNPDGSWTETTRPPGGESYAQRLSTTAWATRALVATRGAAGRR